MDGKGKEGPEPRGADRPTASVEAVRQRLREAGADELAALLQHLGDDLDVLGAQQALRNPFIDERMIRGLVKRSSLLSSYELRRDLATHPKTPRVLASRFLSGMYWGDLLKLSQNVRVPPPTRRLAEQELVQRLPTMALGEKVSLARRGGRTVLHHLRRENHFRVIAALLQNPRLTVDVVQPLAGDIQAAPEILKQLAENPRWGNRYPVRLALCRNPRTPPVVALGLLAALKKTDLKGLSTDRRVPPTVRRRAALLATGGAGGVGRGGPKRRP